MSETTKCVCGHEDERHLYHKGACYVHVCDCQSYRPATPAPSPDHAQARELAELLVRDKQFSGVGLYNLARAYLALAASPAEREPDLDFDAMAHSLAVTFLGLRAVNSPPPKEVLNGVADMLRGIPRTPPASAVTVTEAMCETIVSKLSALRVPDDGDLSLELREYNTAIDDAIAAVWDVRLADESPNTAAPRGTEG